MNEVQILAFSVGGAVVTAQYIGAKKIDKACERQNRLLLLRNSIDGMGDCRTSYIFYVCI